MRRTQEWPEIAGHGLVLDGEFRPATERAVATFQGGLLKDQGVKEPGAIDRAT
jgi:hypothetical protein